MPPGPGCILRLVEGPTRTSIPGVSTATVYEIVKRGPLPHVR